jgi:hypothetical protein
MVLIDTPGRKTGILEVALAASTGVLIPAIPEGGPVSELTSVLRHVASAREMYGAVEVYGIVRMRVGGNTRYRRLAEEQTKEVAAGFGAPVLKNKVPEDAKFGEAHLAREPIGAYAESARSAIAYRFLADELVALRGWPARLDAPVPPNPLQEAVTPVKTVGTGVLAVETPVRATPDRAPGIEASNETGIQTPNQTASSQPAPSQTPDPVVESGSSNEMAQVAPMTPPPPADSSHGTVQTELAPLTMAKSKPSKPGPRHAPKHARKSGV